MLSFIQKNWIHTIIWALMIVYLTVAHDVYNRFILKEGAPVQFDYRVPKPKDEIFFALGRFDLVKGQDLYHLVGVSFVRGDRDQDAYDRWIILASDTNTYFYKAQATQRPELQAMFKDLDIDLSNAGISTHISKYAIKPGEYTVGILFKHRRNDKTHYVITNKKIIRTVNQIRMEATDSQQ